MSIKFMKIPRKFLETIFPVVHFNEEFPDFFVAIYNSPRKSPSDPYAVT